MLASNNFQFVLCTNAEIDEWGESTDESGESTENNNAGVPIDDTNMVL